jgi:hypothetical protein
VAETPPAVSFFCIRRSTYYVVPAGGMQRPTAGIEVRSPKNKRVTDYDLWLSLALASLVQYFCRDRYCDKLMANRSVAKLAG